MRVYSSTSEQRCPTCYAAPGKRCRTEEGFLCQSIHAARWSTEYGSWTAIYDLRFRELPEGKRFNPNPYSRRKAA